MQFPALTSRCCFVAYSQSDEAQKQCERVIAEYFANGRQLPPRESVPSDLIVSELVDRYWEYAKAKYGLTGGTPVVGGPHPR